MPQITGPSESERDLLRRVLGARCRRAREELSLSRRELAEALGRSPSWVREIEAGQQYAPPYLVLTLAENLARPVGWFYGRDESGAPDLARRLVRLERTLGIEA